MFSITDNSGSEKEKNVLTLSFSTYFIHHVKVPFTLLSHQITIHNSIDSTRSQSHQRSAEIIKYILKNTNVDEIDRNCNTCSRSHLNEFVHLYMSRYFLGCCK